MRRKCLIALYRKTHSNGDNFSTKNLFLKRKRLFGTWPSRSSAAAVTAAKGRHKEWHRSVVAAFRSGRGALHTERHSQIAPLKRHGGRRRIIAPPLFFS